MKSAENFTIARVIARLNIGGPAMQAILMTDAFRKKGYRALLLAGEVPAGEGSMEYLAREKDIVPIKIGTMSRRISWRKDLTTFWQLVRVHRERRQFSIPTLRKRARSADWRRSQPEILRVHTFHGHVFRGYFSPLVTRIFLVIERFLARHTDCIIAISESQKQELAEKVNRIAPAKQISVIPLGFALYPFLRVQERRVQDRRVQESRVEERLVQEQRVEEQRVPAQAGHLRQSLGYDAATFLVGWVGQLTAIEVPDLFLRCARQLAGNSRNFRFVLVGGRRLARMRKEGRSPGPSGRRPLYWMAKTVGTNLRRS